MGFVFVLFCLAFVLFVCLFVYQFGTVERCSSILTWFDNGSVGVLVSFDFWSSLVPVANFSCSKNPKGVLVPNFYRNKQEIFL